MSIEGEKQLICSSAAWTAVQWGRMYRGMGIRSVGKGLIAEDLEKMRELNTGAQIEGKADIVLAPMDERRRTKLFLEVGRRSE